MFRYNKISERAQNLLKILVSRYIREGQPIGSRTLSRDVNLDLSPATIRNVMADLEEMGLVCSPHTSAGRVPTVRGYRLFVDTLLQIKPLNNEEESHLRRQFIQEYDIQRLLEQTSSLLSEVTHLAGVVMLPRRDSKALRHVEFLSLSEKRVLVVLVFNEKEVENRIIYTSRSYTSAELQSTANYLNNAFIGKNIKAVRSDLLRELQETRENMDKMMQAVIEMADKAFDSDETMERDFVIAGQTNLMEVADLSNIEKLRDLFIAFSEKHDILHLLDQALKAQSMQIFIGEESGYEVLGDCSVITSPYTVNGGMIGVLGVIGPTRMPYERVIPIVDLTAKLLGSALNHC
ncbi:heat-inducible transcriptional repressor HrcA [Candidatus Parabeggiatoa sp. HSG14]|uniref:heat-inducible transcriptional repressor HrcA n=1 Tax=Candidatus Parabeggiatoa sp. HSG14 TaxID=3055593 RepID=UPI0025A7361B|nr:heat-inducible transcriptional repressor HrcA [Thiotrichales bacterium HSG14]